MEHIPIGILVADVPSASDGPEAVIRKMSRFARDLIGEDDSDLRAYLGAAASPPFRVYDLTV
jgi:hypothetical protein